MQNSENANTSGAKRENKNNLIVGSELFSRGTDKNSTGDEVDAEEADADASAGALTDAAPEAEAEASAEVEVDVDEDREEVVTPTVWED